MRNWGQHSEIECSAVREEMPEEIGTSQAMRLQHDHKKNKLQNAIEHRNNAEVFGYGSEASESGQITGGDAQRNPLTISGHLSRSGSGNEKQSKGDERL